MAITTLKSDATKDRIYVDRSGAVRLERFASADSTLPVTSMLLSGTGFGRTLIVGANTVWVEQDDANGDDPRVWIYYLSGLTSGGGSGCEVTRDSSEAGNWTGATGWRYVGADLVAGRPAHHLACAGEEIWIDDETRLTLRVRQQVIDDAGNPDPRRLQYDRGHEDRIRRAAGRALRLRATEWRRCHADGGVPGPLSGGHGALPGGAALFRNAEAC